jgi:hypothetical protein
MNNKQQQEIKSTVFQAGFDEARAMHDPDYVRQYNAYKAYLKKQKESGEVL